jgi:hypothetical protein
MNTEPLDVYHEAQECLQNTERQYGDVVAASPEPPTQTRDDAARHEGQPNEAEDVVPVSHVASANCVRGEKVAKKARTKEYEPEPNPNAATRIADGDYTWRSHCTSKD